MNNISSTTGSGHSARSFAEKKVDLTQGVDLPASPFEDEEQRLVHQHRRNARTRAPAKGGRGHARRLISL